MIYNQVSNSVKILFRNLNIKKIFFLFLLKQLISHWMRSQCTNWYVRQSINVWLSGTSFTSNFHTFYILLFGTELHCQQHLPLTKRQSPFLTWEAMYIFGKKYSSSNSIKWLEGANTVRRVSIKSVNGTRCYNRVYILSVTEIYS